MIQLKLLEKNEIDATGKLVYLVDNTGEFGPENQGGYGGDNPIRGELAIFPIAIQVDSKGKEKPLTFQTFDQVKDQEWVVKVEQDGWLQFSLAGIPVIQSPKVEDYQDGDVIFSLDEYQILEKKDSTIWKVLQPNDLRNTKYEGKRFEQFHIAYSSRVKNELNKRKTELQMSSESLSNKKSIALIQEQYDLVRGIIQAAVYQFCIGNKYAAVSHIEFLQTNNYEQLQ